MKLPARDIATYCAKPDPNRAGVLIYGADAMRVSMRRQSMIRALLGPQGSEEMRLTRLSGADLRKDPAALIDAVKAQGFFPGQRVVFLEDAADGLTKTIAAALQDWQQGDAQIIVTAGQLRASSNLRKTFETHPNTYAIAIYDDPPSQAEIAAELQKAGLQNLGDIGLKALSALARELEPGDFRQTLEKLALYKLHDATPLGLEEMEQLTAHSGNLAMPGFTAPKLMWLKRHEPEIFHRIRQVLLPKDYLRWLLTGVFATDPSDASGTLWMNPETRQWDDTLIEMTDAQRDWLPHVFEGPEETGSVTTDASRKYGLPRVPVVAGGGDNACGALALGICQPGQTLISLGTSGVIFTVSRIYFTEHAESECVLTTAHHHDVKIV